jgi:hypothetical protein
VGQEDKASVMSEEGAGTLLGHHLLPLASPRWKGSEPLRAQGSAFSDFPVQGGGPLLCPLLQSLGGHKG